MANTILNSTVILRKFLDIFHNKIKFSSVADRQYDASFKTNGVSGKPGTSLSVRMPAQFTIRSGKTANVQNIVADSKTITCSTQEGIDFAFTSEQATMNIDDLEKLVLEPIASRLASRVDQQGLAQYVNVANSIGDFSVDSADDLLAVGERLSNNCCPEDGRILMLNPKGNRTLVGAFTFGTNTMPNPSDNLSKQFKSGYLTSAYGFDISMSQNVNTHTCGTRIATDDQYGIATSATFESAATVTLDSAYAVTYVAGDTVTLDGIYDVNPETKESTGYLKQFAIKTAASSSSTLVVTPTPILYSTDPARANCTGALNTSGYVNVTGVASTAYGMNLAFHPKAFTLVTADLQLPNGVNMAARETMDGISMRMISDYDVVNDQFIGRFDIYYGWTALRPEWACRLPGSVG